MLASVLVSAGGGSMSQPVAGGVKLQIFLSNTTNNVISKLVDETDVGIVGYNFPNCVGLRIRFFLSNYSVPCAGVPGAKARCSPAGG